MNQAEKMSLTDMEELYSETEAGTYLPIRFRKMPYSLFVAVYKAKYLSYLADAIKELKERIENEGKVQKAGTERRAPFVRKAR